ncbi:hypothetical protein PIB30_038299 [Stylosanthes scabra]|uniref:Uncharacterized protein n=1 Tax=Stylosanthes scabra TaxID=79078 RepID=A0ABU6SEN6_9FABA|nr:hypothetical protein [Stylosanthes scabra]
MGVVPTVAFKNTTTRISQMNLGSSNDIGTSSTCGSTVQEELNTVKAKLQALASYIASKKEGSFRSIWLRCSLLNKLHRNWIKGVKFHHQENMGVDPLEQATRKHDHY